MPTNFHRIDADRLPDFVTFWQTAPSLNAVVLKFGIDRMDCSAIASHLRKKGVPLKKFQTYSNGVDYAALAALAEDAS